MLKKSMLIVMSLLLIAFLTGCLFSAKEIVLDPDKGYTHAEKLEANNE